MLVVQDIQHMVLNKLYYLVSNKNVFDIVLICFKQANAHIVQFL